MSYQLPAFFCPIMPLQHPAVDEIEKGSIAWIDSLGLASSEQQRQALIDTDAANFCSYIIPRGITERLQWFANWFYWFWAVDAYSDEGPGSRRTADYVYLASSLASLAAMPSAPPQPTPLLEALRQCASAFAGYGTPAQLRRWYEEQRTWLFGVTHQVAISEQDRMPDVAEYLSHRLPGSAAAVGLAGVEMVTGHDLPPGLIDTLPVRAMSEMSGFIVALDNDLLSYPLEEKAMSNNQNIVNVLRHHRGLSMTDAIAEAKAMRDSVMLRFLRLTEAASSGAGQALRLYIESLHGVVAGNLTWAPQAPRYRRHFPGGAVNLDITARTDAVDRPLPYLTTAWWWDV